MPFLAETTCPIPTQDICSWIFDKPSYNIDQPRFIDIANTSNYITARQAKSLVRKLCAGFRKAGLKKGDCVVLHGFNSIYYPIVTLGIVAFGGIWAGTNPSYTPFELAHHLKTSRAKFVIAEPDILDSLLVAAKENNIPDSHIVLFDHSGVVTTGKPPAHALQSWTTLLAHGEEDWVRFDDEKTQANTEAARLFSSGTTGLPKAVMISHRNFVTQHTVVLEIRPRPWTVRRLFALPMFHGAIAPVCHTSTLREGSTAFIQRRWAVDGYLAAIAQHAITDMIIVPAQVIAILNSPQLTRKYDLSSIRSVLAGAAPMDKETQGRFAALLAKEASVTQVWGMTETCCVATSFEWDEQDDTASVGRPKANMDFKIIDDEGKDISDFDVRAEISVRGPGVVLGYLGAKEGEVNRGEWDADGFMRTGDVGFRSSKNGLWYLVDRKKELIKVRGFQVAPAELEGVLLDHPGIADAGVIGVKFERDGSEFPRAYIVRTPDSAGAALTEKDVQKFLGSKLSSYKRLDGGVVFTDVIPKNASGKILKRILRETAARELGAKL